MSKIREWSAGLTKTIHISKRELLLATTACTLGGMVLGMLFSPKKRIMIGSNNGNGNIQGYGDGQQEEEASAEAAGE